MDTNEIDSGSEPDAAPARNWKKSWIATGALAAGLAVGAAGVAGAATGSGSSSSSDTSGAASSAPAAPGDGQAPTGRPPSGQAPSGAQDGSRPDPASMPNGPGETVLTGDDATKAKAAALEAVPGATVIRVETDSSGEAKYEAHLTKSDGTQVTVLMDENFEVTATVDGFGGPGPQGRNGGQPPQGGPQGGPGYGGATTSN